MNAGILDQSDTGSLRNSMPTPNALKKYGDWGVTLDERVAPVARGDISTMPGLS